LRGPLQARPGDGNESSPGRHLDGSDWQTPRPQSGRSQTTKAAGPDFRRASAAFGFF